MHKHKKSRTTALLATLIVAVGCSKNDWGYLSGTVTINGQPIGPGVVSLEPVDGQHAGAIAPFGEDGKYTVISARRKKGAPIGEYRVTIHSNLKDFGFEDKGKRAAIPSRYENPKTSELAVKVEPGTKDFDFDLKP
jgi:hypothetical protein